MFAVAFVAMNLASRQSPAATHASAGYQVFLTIDYGVFGDDSRTAVPDKYTLQKEAVAKLVSSGDPVIRCTAFCVAPDMVATASHCLFSTRESGRLSPLSSFVVEIDSDAGPKRAKIKGADEEAHRWNVIAGTTRFPKHAPLQNAHDWALIKLSTAVCKNRMVKILPMRNKDILAAVFNKRIFAIGFMGRGTTLPLTYSGNCETTKNIAQLNKAWSAASHMFSDARHVVLHRCDLGPGASGSPLFLEKESGPVVIALNNGTIPVPARILYGKSPEQRRRLISAIPTAANYAVSVDALHRQIRLMQSLPRRLTSQEVARVQLFLKSIGYFKGEADGVFDIRLRQAVIDFERHEKLIVTGRPTLSLLRAFK